MTFQTTKRPDHWYAVYVLVRSEKKLQAALEQKGIECYLPLKTERRQWSDRVKVVQEPLLRGYIFVRVNNKEYYEVLNTSGAIRYVCFDDKPAAIPDRQLESLRIFVEQANASLEVTTERIRKGTGIRVVTGPLKGVTGEVVEIRGRKRVLLRFGTLGYYLHAELGTQNIEVVSGKNEAT